MTDFIRFRCKDGSMTVAKTASLGFFYWYARFFQKKHSISIPIPLDGDFPLVFQSIEEISSPYDPNFLVLAIGAIERSYGKSPEIPQELFGEAWYKDLPDDTDNYERVRESQNPKILTYEKTCLTILQWLAKYGDITELEISNE